MVRLSNRIRRLRGRAPIVVVLLGVMMSGCSTDFGSTLFNANQPSESTADAATATPTSPADQAAARSASVLAESRKLKSAGKQKDALALLEKNSQGPNADKVLLIERGFNHLELGQPEAAKKVLLQVAAADKEKTDWRVFSAIGVAFASQNRPKEAQKYFTQALKASPNNPAVLNNMALAHMIDRKPREAENVLRNAMTGKSFPPQVTRNLALAQALQVTPADDTTKSENTSF